MKTHSIVLKEIRILKHYHISEKSDFAVFKGIMRLERVPIILSTDFKALITVFPHFLYEAIINGSKPVHDIHMGIVMKVNAGALQ